jgi:hypothetical protein
VERRGGKRRRRAPAAVIDKRPAAPARADAEAHHNSRLAGTKQPQPGS